MTTRTFIQAAQGYGPVPVNAQVKIDGTIVFDGAVPTIDAPLPVMPDDNIAASVPNCYTWTNDVNFEGTQTLEISITGGTLLLGPSLANYPAQLGNLLSSGIIASGNTDPANTYSAYYSYYDSEIGDIVFDPLSDETIDGVLQPHTPQGTMTGQWWWVLSPGSTFSATINVQAGNIGNV